MEHPQFGKRSDCIRAGVRGYMLRELLLTPRQLKVLELLADRYGTMEIAEKLVLSVRTVRDTIHELHQTLGTRDRGQLVGGWHQVFGHFVDVLGVSSAPPTLGPDSDRNEAEVAERRTKYRSTNDDGARSKG